MNIESRELIQSRKKSYFKKFHDDRFEHWSIDFPGQTKQNWQTGSFERMDEFRIRFHKTLKEESFG